MPPFTTPSNVELTASVQAPGTIWTASRFVGSDSACMADVGDGQGAVHVYSMKDDFTWEETYRFTPPEQVKFWNSIALDNDTAVLSGYMDTTRRYLVYISRRQSDGSYRLWKRCLASNGVSSLAVSGSTIMVGNYDLGMRDAEGVWKTGGVGIYERADNGTGPDQRISAEQNSSWFGYAIDLSGNRVVIGAFREETAHWGTEWSRISMNGMLTGIGLKRRALSLWGLLVRGSVLKLR